MTAIRTFKEQRDLEAKLRKEWLQGLADLKLSQTETAGRAEMDRRVLIEMMQKHGIDFARPRNKPKKYVSQMAIRDKKYKKLASLGMTRKEAAEAMGCHMQTIQRAEARLGINYAKEREQAANPRKKVTASPDAIKRAMDTHAAIRRQQARRFMADVRQPHN